MEGSECSVKYLLKLSHRNTAFRLSRRYIRAAFSAAARSPSLGHDYRRSTREYSKTRYTYKLAASVTRRVIIQTIGRHFTTHYGKVQLNMVGNEQHCNYANKWINGSVPVGRQNETRHITSLSAVL